MILPDGGKPLLNKQYFVSIILTLCSSPAFVKNFAVSQHMFTLYKVL